MIRLDSERMDHSLRLAIDVVVDMLVALRCVAILRLKWWKERY